jgi:hypothetical protein
MMEYADFISEKLQWKGESGFEPTFIPEKLFDFQKEMTRWAIKKGRSAIVEDCGLGKTFQELVWAQNVVEHTNKRVLIAAPLAVSHQFVREGEKFGIEIDRSSDGKPAGKITVTNYERLKLFDPSDYIGFCGDEGGILKNFKSQTKALVIEFVRKMPYRLFGSATFAPNDYIELGNTAEALGVMGFMDMLEEFFKNTQNESAYSRGHFLGHGGEAPKWRFKPHGVRWFWKFVSSWAKAIRRPSDLGFSDDGYDLPPLIEDQHIVDVPFIPPGEMFPRLAIGLGEQRKEMKRTINERCELVADLMLKRPVSIAWCHLNAEQDKLEKLLGDKAFSVHGGIKDDEKEKRILGFINRERPYLITKPRVAGFGLNLQFCDHMAYFTGHSFEQFYQSTRRCWRFGQKKPVTVDVVTTQGCMSVLKNLQRKAKQAERLYSELVANMNSEKSFSGKQYKEDSPELPRWIAGGKFDEAANY